MTMHAMILAAGLGTRMRPLTDSTPKALLKVLGKPLIQFHVEALASAGVTDIVVNHGVFGEQIEAAFGSGERYGLRIRYSPEGQAPLETAGGIRRALPLLGDAPFIVVNADIWTDFDYASLRAEPSGLAHLLLAANPEHHPGGDFGLENGRVRNTGRPMYTYAGIGVFRPELFAGLPEGKRPLAPLLREAIAGDGVSGEVLSGRWFDVGTPERLERLNRIL